MGKIKDFLCKRFNEEFWIIFAALLAMTAMVIGLQSLLFWIGGLFSSVKCLGLIINIVIGLALVIPIMIGVVLGSSFQGDGNILLSLLSIIGIYVCVVFWFNWLLLIGCIALLCINLVVLDKTGGDKFWLYGGACTYLLYCIGTYFAMLFNGLDPAADICGISVLSAATFGIWLKPCFERTLTDYTV